jgi:hypothetical protein
MAEGRVPSVAVPAAVFGRGIPSSEAKKSFQLLRVGWAEKGTYGLRVIDIVEGDAAPSDLAD